LGQNSNHKSPLDMRQLAESCMHKSWREVIAREVTYKGQRLEEYPRYVSPQFLPGTLF